MVLSKDKAEKMKVWDQVERAYHDREIITGRVIERVKGGLAVDIGVRAFLPGSQVDLRPVRNLETFRGQELRMRVIKVNKRRGNIVLSRKVVLEEENAGRKKETLDGLEEGKVILGTVKNITDYGAFVDLGGLDGLLHITDISWGRINHPTDVLKVGDEIKVQVLKFDRETERVFSRIQAAQGGPVDDRRDQVPDRHPRHREGRQLDGLRRVRRAGAGRRGPHPRLRNVMVQEGQASLEDPRGRPGGRVPGVGDRPGGPPHQPGPEAGRGQPVG